MTLKAKILTSLSAFALIGGAVITTTAIGISTPAAAQ